MSFSTSFSNYGFYKQNSLYFLISIDECFEETYSSFSDDDSVISLGLNDSSFSDILSSIFFYFSKDGSLSFISWDTFLLAI